MLKNSMILKYHQPYHTDVFYQLGYYHFALLTCIIARKKISEARGLTLFNIILLSWLLAISTIGAKNTSEITPKLFRQKYRLYKHKIFDGFSFS